MCKKCSRLFHDCVCVRNYDDNPAMNFEEWLCEIISCFTKQEMKYINFTAAYDQGLTPNEVYIRYQEI